MKTAICYYSRHHGNTLKLLEAMAKGRPDAADLQAAKDFFDGLVTYDPR